jgi:hypothetical protein
MSTRQFVTKSGDTWEVEENEEVVEAIKDYWKIVKANQSKSENK